MFGLERSFKSGREPVFGWRVIGVGEATAALVSVGQQNFLNEWAEAELVVDEGLGECVEHIGVRRRIIGMIEVERFNETASDEHPPESVGEVS